MLNAIYIPMKLVIEAKNIDKSYRKHTLFAKGAKTLVLNNVNFNLEPCTTHALVGESGSGKTTLSKILLNLEKPDKGTLCFEEKDVLAMNKAALKKMRAKMQVIFQDPYSSLNPRMTVFDIISEPYVIHNVYKTKKEKREKIVNILKSVGLSADVLNRYPHEFSGGQRQRICIARALALRPDVIIADEPVSSLDVSVQAQILNLLKELKEQYNLSYVFISHDFAAVRFIADTISVMYKGEIVESAPNGELFNNPSHPYTRELLAAVPSVETKNKPAPPVLNLGSSQCSFYSRCPEAADICTTQKPALLEVADRHFCKCLRAGGFEVNKKEKKSK